MPDRIIRESICVSDTLNKLTDFEERFWHRLIVNCDDYGRFDARPEILKGRLFPLLETKKASDMEKALLRLAEVGLLRIYEAGGKKYLEICTWQKYQIIRAKKSRYPEPTSFCEQLQTSANNCQQMPANVSVIRNSECVIRNSKFEMRNTKFENICTEPQSASEPPFITLPLNNGSEYEIYNKDIEYYSSLYPAVDIQKELRKMKGWCDSNPAKRKTARGIKGFITNWLSKEQDKGGSRIQSAAPQSSNPFAEMIRNGEITDEQNGNG